jgi:very-short-patch-repair endonuclease/predicted transcriptional regulator of viral defense system
MPATQHAVSAPVARGPGELGPPERSRNEIPLLPVERRDLAARRAAQVVGRVLRAGLTRDRAVAEVAAAQYGVITRAQLAALGLGFGAIDHRVATGRLHRLHRGVYAVGHTALVPLARELAAVLACGPDAVLSHHSAAALWGLRPDPGADIDVTVGRSGASHSRPGLRVHRTRSLDARDIRLRRGIPTTSPARTLVDLAATATQRELERAVDEAQVRGLARRGELLNAVQHAAPGRRGSTLLTQVLRGEGAPTLTRSEAEDRLLGLIAAARLPRPEVNVRVCGHEVDLLWRDSRLVVEVDGYAFHSTRTAFERDRARDADLQAGDFRVLRVTWRQIADQPYALIARIAQALVVRDHVERGAPDSPR